MGEQATHIDLAGSARCLGWEVLALGRPASDLPMSPAASTSDFA
ncbi:hypothetical protein Q427_01540 [Halomonas sp. BC04]|nr:hypothetical protein Q427_01540 [Halomonas sp. BC04]